MGSIEQFDGTGSFHNWKAQVKAKLMTKGFDSCLGDRPDAGNAQAPWDALASKAVGQIRLYLEPSLIMQFEEHTTPKALFNAIEENYKPNREAELDRLENELMNLTYDGSDPVAWVAKVRHLLAKIRIRGLDPHVRTVRNLVLKALEREPQYRARIEVIRYSSPNITLEELWRAVSAFPYPLEKEDNDLLLAALEQKLMSRFNRDDMADKSNRVGSTRPPAPWKTDGVDESKLTPEEMKARDIKYGRCFGCHKGIHPQNRCYVIHPELKRKVGGNSPNEHTVTSSGSDVREKSGSGGASGTKQPNNFALIMQEVARVQSAPPPKKAKDGEERKTPAPAKPVVAAKFVAPYSAPVCFPQNWPLCKSWSDDRSTLR